MNYGNVIMKSFFYVVILLAVATVFFATGCTEKPVTGNDTIADPISADTLEADTLETILEAAPVPKAADGLFDDFLFNFAANRKLQYSRIVFPLLADYFGQETHIERKEWKMEHFFMRQGFYTLVAGTSEELYASKDKKVSQAVVEKVMFSDHCVMQYVFRRVEGQWFMQELRKQRLADNVNGTFYAFYNKFVSDSLYRQESLAENVEFSGPDPDDDFSRIEGSIMPEQFSMFVPEIPHGTIFNVVYGEPKPMPDQRVLVVRGVSNGFEIEMTFQKVHGRFMLTALST